jgi:hypothetical protein
MEQAQAAAAAAIARWRGKVAGQVEAAALRGTADVPELVASYLPPVDMLGDHVAGWFARACEVMQRLTEEAEELPGTHGVDLTGRDEDYTEATRARIDTPMAFGVAAWVPFGNRTTDYVTSINNQDIPRDEPDSTLFLARDVRPCDGAAWDWRIALEKDLVEFFTGWSVSRHTPMDVVDWSGFLVLWKKPTPRICADPCSACAFDLTPFDWLETLTDGTCAAGFATRVVHSHGGLFFLIPARTPAILDRVRGVFPTLLEGIELPRRNPDRAAKRRKKWGAYSL